MRLTVLVPQQSQEVGGDVAMDRMKKILSSPITKKRALSSSRYFGVPLEDVIKREGRLVPFLVEKICTYIQENGITCEGIFRVNGNSRVVERLRTSFDRNGDADLEEAGDVMAVAGLLKLYLRELPEGVIPDHMTKLFVTTQLECSNDITECIARLRVLLRSLPSPAYNLLKFLSRFLTFVSQEEKLNKMNPVALGIVFGPNLFRCSGGIEGLRQQGVTNQIVLHFITQYDALFLEADEISPYSSATTQVVELSKPRSNPPPRPPPPQRDGAHSPPIPSPRKMRSRVAILQDEDLEASDESRGLSPRNSVVTPRLSDDEYLETYRSASPFVLDRVVEKAISSTVAQHMFGDVSSDDETSSDAPRRKRRDHSDSPDMSDSLDDPGISSVKARIQKFEMEEDEIDIVANGNDSLSGKPQRDRPRSKAFDLFESQGLIIQPATDGMQRKLMSEHVEVPVEDSDEEEDEDMAPRNNLFSQPRPQPKPRAKRNNKMDDGVTTSQDSLANVDSDDSGFSSIQRNTSPLTSFKRAPGPKNRRTPSRRSLRQSKLDMNQENNKMASEEEEEETGSPVRVPPARPPPPSQLIKPDENHNASTKPSINFLNIHLNGREDRISPERSPDRSPTAQRKPYVPPLDLSILHEHGDGSDPIPVEQGHSLVIHKVKTMKDDDDGGVMLSPRMSKLKKKARENLGPSYRISVTRIEEDHSMMIKQLTKKIQSCKRKIKMFEEAFEEERGYRPSQADKAANLEVKKTIQELAKARKEFRKLKEEIENFEHWGDSTMPPMETRPMPKDAFVEEVPPRMEETLDMLLRRLDDKRRDAARPEDLILMSRDQVCEEKLAVQKALLQYENLHGRPSSKYEKELMKPLYDRYRQIKRMLAKPPSPRERSKTLESVPEDHTVEFATSPASSAKTTDREPVRIPTADPEETEHPVVDREFLVTRDFGLLKETMKVEAHEKHDVSPEGDLGWNNDESPLHELSKKELLEEQQKARLEKKRLRRVLREFEDDFQKQTGRKVQKEDRAPMDAEYFEYKQVKARLKLLEALLSKHNKADGW